MSNRSLHWLRRHTNVADLLDDGIENNSDLSSFAVPGDSADPGTNASIAPRSGEQQRAPKPFVPPTMRESISLTGILIGGVLLLGGVLLVLLPVDMDVFHHRVMYLPSFVEHATPFRSRVYGSAGILLGLIVLAFATVRHRA
jgi:hypothetical protein